MVSPRFLFIYFFEPHPANRLCALSAGGLGDSVQLLLWAGGLPWLPGIQGKLRLAPVYGLP